MVRDIKNFLIFIVYNIRVKYSITQQIYNEKTKINYLINLHLLNQNQRRSILGKNTATRKTTSVTGDAVTSVPLGATKRS